MTIASSIVSGNRVVTTAGTQVQLVLSTTVTSEWVVITAAPANTGRITVGDANVDATADAEAGITLGPGDSVSLPVRNLSSVWIDSTVSGDEVGYLYGTSVA